MQLDNKNNLIVNINNRTQLYSEKEIKKALQDYENNKIITDQTINCANHDRDTEEAIHTYYKSEEDFIWAGTPTKDPIVEAVRKDLLDRSTVGLKKYNTSLSRTDLSLKNWCQHLYEEILDSANYLKRIIIELESKETDNLLDVHNMD